MSVIESSVMYIATGEKQMLAAPILKSANSLGEAIRRPQVYYRNGDQFKIHRTLIQITYQFNPVLQNESLSLGLTVVCQGSRHDT